MRSENIYKLLEVRRSIESNNRGATRDCYIIISNNIKRIALLFIAKTISCRILPHQYRLYILMPELHTHISIYCTGSPSVFKK